MTAGSRRVPKLLIKCIYNKIVDSVSSSLILACADGRLCGRRVSAIESQEITAVVISVQDRARQHLWHSVLELVNGALEFIVASLL